jgi:hypothetical protein
MTDEAKRASWLADWEETEPPREGDPDDCAYLTGRLFKYAMMSSICCRESMMPGIGG